MHKAVAKTKSFVCNHKIAIAATAVAISAIALQQRQIRVTDGFLKEHDLFDAYWKTGE